MNASLKKLIAKELESRMKNMYAADRADTCGSTKFKFPLVASNGTFKWVCHIGKISKSAHLLEWLKEIYSETHANKFLWVPECRDDAENNFTVTPYEWGSMFDSIRCIEFTCLNKDCCYYIRGEQPRNFEWADNLGVMHILGRSYMAALIDLQHLFEPIKHHKRFMGTNYNPENDIHKTLTVEEFIKSRPDVHNE